MIVTTGATKRDSQKRQTGCRDHVIQAMELLVIGVGVVLQLCAQMNELTKRFELRRCVAFVQVHSDKTVKRHILIRCANHGISKLEGIPSYTILIHRQRALALAKPNHVQPMPPPAFTETRTLQQTINQAFIGLRFGIGNKRANLLDRRWQASQTKRHPSNQRMPIGLRLRLQSILS